MQTKTAGIQVFYNSACPVCDAGISTQKDKMTACSVQWRDVNTDTQARDDMPAELEFVRKRLHALDEYGNIKIGIDAFALIWRHSPTETWKAHLISLPVIKPIMILGYNIVAAFLYKWNLRKGHWKIKQHQSNPSENAANFHCDTDDVFGRIANRYDLLCDLFSFGIHRLWKRRVVDIIAQGSWTNLLDVAAGTGDIALRVARHKKLQPHQKIVITDISPKMLSIAQQRAIKYKSNIKFTILNAHAMPEIPDASVDLFSISLGLKICERTQVLHEAFRVLQPGGHIVALESSNISFKWLHNSYLFYMSICMPIIGWIATRGDASAYRYLIKGIADFPTAEEFKSELCSIGFEDVIFERLSLGIVAIHMARKPICI